MTIFEPQVMVNSNPAGNAIIYGVVRSNEPSVAYRGQALSGLLMAFPVEVKRD